MVAWQPTSAGQVIKSWTTNQRVMALPSGEANLDGVIKGMEISLGIAALTKDLEHAGPIKLSIRSRVQPK